MKKYFILILSFISLSILSQEEKRLALVIGNANYDKGVLKNPVNDALLIKTTLEKLNFDVILDTNIQKIQDFKSVVRKFGEEREKYNVGFVYYAGHGIQINNENFLLPTKEVFNSKYDVLDNALSVQNIMRYLTAKTNQVNVMILDACRDNPFEKNWMNQTRGDEKGRGLAKIPPPTGSLIAFSTDAGNTALDGNGENSVYCESLAKNFMLVNTSIDQIFRNVRSDVLKLTNNMQRPVEASQLTGQAFYLIRKKDYNKIEISEIEKEAKDLNQKGEIKQALDKYTILEIYLKSQIENINKKKLTSVYFEMGQIYLTMYYTEPDKFYNEKIENDQWDKTAYNEYLRMGNLYLENAANAFLNAKSLYEGEVELTKKEKDDYSEAYYKYLRCQSYMDFEEFGINDSLFTIYINDLNKFNQNNFGNKDFRTACSHYLTGLFYKDYDPVISYNNFRKSAEIFNKSKYSNEELNEYAFSFNPTFPYKWAIMVINDILNESFTNSYVKEDLAKKTVKFLKKNFHKNVDSLYHINIQLIEEGIVTAIEHDNYDDIDGLYATAIDFAHTFPIVFEVVNEIDENIYHQSTVNTINFTNAALEYSTSYLDSIKAYTNNITTYNNHRSLIDEKLTDSIAKTDKTIFDLHEKALGIAKYNEEAVAVLYVINQFLELYYDYNSLISFYNYEALEKRLNIVNDSYVKIIREYKKDDDAYFLDEYINIMDVFVEKKLLKEDLVLKFKEQKKLFDIFFSDEE